MNQFQHYDFQLQLILALLATFIVMFALFFFLTYYSRYRRIKKSRTKIHYQEIIDKVLFDLLFDEHTDPSTAATIFKTKTQSHRIASKLGLKSLMVLHRNYSGQLRLKLESFYVQSGLSQYSFNKLNSRNWSKVVEGIRDLSTMNHQPAYKAISDQLRHPKVIVRSEAFIALVVLRGTEELQKLRNSDLYLDDWAQSNILYNLKRTAMKPPTHPQHLLESPNETIRLLAARLIEYYQMFQHTGAIENAIITTGNSTLRNKLQIVLNRIKNEQP